MTDVLELFERSVADAKLALLAAAREGLEASRTAGGGRISECLGVADATTRSPSGS
jgi:hypothetical protein